MSKLRVAKNALRQQMKLKLKEITSLERGVQSEVVFKKILKLPEFLIAERVSVYVSMPTEIETETLIRHMLRQGKQVFIPRYRESSTLMEMVRVPSEKDFDELPLTKWNIRQPAADIDWPEALESGGLDVVFCPGVAFTRMGHRLGHGKGYYDRYISRVIEQCKRPVLVGLALNEQICDSIPCDSSDIVLDKVISSDSP